MIDPHRSAAGKKGQGAAANGSGPAFAAGFGTGMVFCIEKRPGARPPPCPGPAGIGEAGEKRGKRGEKQGFRPREV